MGPLRRGSSQITEDLDYHQVIMVPLLLKYSLPEYGENKPKENWLIHVHLYCKKVLKMKVAVVVARHTFPVT